MTSDARPATLQDVADRAGVARGTASSALSGKGRMSDATRRRVRHAAAELGYVANSVARNLRAARSGAVGMYFPDRALGFRYYMEVAFGAVERALQDDLLVTLLPSDGASDAPFARQLDGFMVIDPQDGDPVIERLLRSGRPVVSGERTPVELPAPAGLVHSDHEAGIRAVLDHVRERGGRRILCVLPDASTDWGRALLAGCRSWSAENDLPLDILAVAFDSTTDELRTAAETRLAANPGVDAVIGARDGAALMLVDILRTAGRAIGHDILLASYVDGEALALVEPAITAMDLHPREMGRLCAELLLETMADPGGGPRAVDLPIDLVERASTKALVR